MDSSDYWQFPPGARVITVEGLAGIVEAVEDGPYPGAEAYIVRLDAGLGGGAYAPGELRQAGSTTAATDSHGHEVVQQPDEDWWSHSDGSVSEEDGSTISDGTVAHTAADDYPELGDILVERPPLAHAVTGAKQVDAAWEPVALGKTAGAVDWLADKAGDAIDRHLPDGYHVDVARQEMWSYDWCRFRKNRRCMFPSHLNEAATREAGYGVWVPMDRGVCPRDKWDDQKVCPVSEPGPKSGDPKAKVDATTSWEEGGQRGGRPMAGGVDSLFTSSLQVTSGLVWADTQEPLTDEDYLELGRANGLDVVRDRSSKVKWQNTKNMIEKLVLHFMWARGDLDMVPNNFVPQPYPKVSPEMMEWAEQIKVGHSDFDPNEQVTFRQEDLYQLMGELALPPWPDGNGGHLGGDVDCAPLAEHIDQRVQQTRISSIDPEFRFHFTAAWSDVRAKAKRIRSEGGVRIIATPGKGNISVTAEVKGDTALYETTIIREPGKKHSVAMWECGCAWASYSWGRTGRWKRFEGRMCSHALATMFEANAQGMFGGTPTEQAQKPPWRQDSTQVVRQPTNYPKPKRRAVRTDADLAEPPIVSMARAMLGDGDDPNTVLAYLEEHGSGGLIAQALKAPRGFKVKVRGYVTELLELLEDGMALLGDGRKVRPSECYYPTFDPRLGLDLRDSTPHISSKEAYFTEDSPTAERVGLVLRAMDYEVKVSPILNQIAQRFGGTLEGFSFRLKAYDSLARKIEKVMREKRCDRATAIKGIGDALRYTIAFPTDRYVEGLGAVLKALREGGFPVRDGGFKNYWLSGDPYQGVNLAMLTPDGFPWELQVHTPESYAHKETNHKLYEVMQDRTGKTTPQQRRDAWDEMTLKAFKLPQPMGVANVGYFKYDARPAVALRRQAGADAMYRYFIRDASNSEIDPSVFRMYDGDDDVRFERWDPKERAWVLDMEVGRGLAVGGTSATEVTQEEAEFVQRAITRFVVTTAADVEDGVMVALVPPVGVSKALSTLGDEPVDNLHVTVLYLGKTADIDEPTLNEVVSSFVADRIGLIGKIGGFGVFLNGDTNVLIANIDCPGLEQVKVELQAALEARGIAGPNNHGYTPHLTLAYCEGECEVPMAVPEAAAGDVPFYDLVVAYGGVWTHYPFGLGVPSESPLQAAAAKDERFKGVGLKQDDDGWYVQTHRARSDSYPTPEDIPQKDVDFIESTGATHVAEREAAEKACDHFEPDPEFGEGTCKNCLWAIGAHSAAAGGPDGHGGFGPYKEAGAAEGLEADLVRSFQGRPVPDTGESVTVYRDLSGEPKSGYPAKESWSIKTNRNSNVVAHTQGLRIVDVKPDFNEGARKQFQRKVERGPHAYLTGKVDDYVTGGSGRLISYYPDLSVFFFKDNRMQFGGASAITFDHDRCIAEGGIEIGSEPLPRSRFEPCWVCGADRKVACPHDVQSVWGLETAATLVEAGVAEDAMAMLHEGFEAGEVDADRLTWYAPTDAGQSLAEADLHERPEPALPTTDGADEDEEFERAVEAAVIIEALDDPSPIVQEAMGEAVAESLAQTPPGPGDPRLSWLMSGTPQGGSSDTLDIAAAARAHLGKEALKAFTPAEQAAIINEGEGATAANLDLLEIQGTHYEALEAALSAEEDDSWLD